MLEKVYIDSYMMKVTKARDSKCVNKINILNIYSKVQL